MVGIRQARNENKIRCMRFECWIIKATNTNSEYSIIVAFPRQKLLGEST